MISVVDFKKYIQSDKLCYFQYLLLLLGGLSDVQVSIATIVEV